MSVYKNVVTNVKTRPPLVIFTICLLGIIVTTATLTYYVHNHDKIVNEDAINDWISILKHINQLHLCGEIDKSPVHLDKLPRDTSMVTIATPAKLLGVDISKSTNLQGVIHLNDWYSKCPEKSFIASYLELEFTVGKRNMSSEEEVCVTITGPSQLLPILSMEQFCKTPVNSKNENTGTLSIPQKDTDCKTGWSFRLEFDITYNKQLKYDTYLTKEDRIIINSHLIVTSCFLMFIVVVITCYAIIKKTTGAVSESKQHLMTKGMYL